MVFSVEFQCTLQTYRLTLKKVIYMQDDMTGISTVIRMLVDIDRKINAPMDEVRVMVGQLRALEEQVAQLTERIDNHVEYSEKAVGQALDTAGKADIALEHKLDSMNKFRETLIDQAKTFMTIEVYNSNHRLLEVKVESLQKFMYLITGALLVIQVLIGFIEQVMP